LPLLLPGERALDGEGSHCRLASCITEGPRLQRRDKKRWQHTGESASVIAAARVRKG